MNCSAERFSNDEIANIAKSSRAHFQKRLGDGFFLDNEKAIDVLACLACEDILARKGVKILGYKILPDVEMDDDGLTKFGADEIVIHIKRSVYEAARLGEGRARFTIAHEIGHAVLHDGGAKARQAGVRGTKSSIGLKPFENAERQANVFAAAFLIDDEIASVLGDARAIAQRFLVSLECSEIKYQEINYKKNRSASIRRVEEKAAIFRAINVPDPVTGRFLDAICPCCGLRTLESIGSKMSCRTCGRMGDLFQDGDS